MLADQVNIFIRSIKPRILLQIHRLWMRSNWLPLVKVCIISLTMRISSSSNGIYQVIPNLHKDARGRSFLDHISTFDYKSLCNFISIVCLVDICLLNLLPMLLLQWKHDDSSIIYFDDAVIKN